MDNCDKKYVVISGRLVDDAMRNGRDVRALDRKASCTYRLAELKVKQYYALLAIAQQDTERLEFWYMDGETHEFVSDDE